MNAPLVTLGVTAYNAADSVERAVGSALAQTWRPIEVVVVDDASSDGTPEILRRLAAEHCEIRVFRNEVNSGVAYGRNRILTEARGEFVAFFDDDDESLPERVATQLRRIVAYEAAFAGGAPVICHTARCIIYDWGEEYAPTMGQHEDRRAPAGPAVARRILMGEPLEDAYGACATCSQMARVSTYRAVDGFDANLRRSEDTDLTVRLAEAGCHFVGVAEPLVVQTMTPTSEKSLADECRHTLVMLEKNRTIMEREGQYEFCRRWIELKWAWLERRRVTFAVGLLGLALRHPLLTWRRLTQARRNVALNRNFSRFHKAART
ncbi:MAG: glycosyltransferase family 2 protein [Alphaproteobacteria bacterium]